MDKDLIMKKICLLAEVLDFDVNNNIEAISKLKSRFPEWRTCPCDPQNPKRYCGSKLCEDDTIGYGHCHCNLFLRRKV